MQVTAIPQPLLDSIARYRAVMHNRPHDVTPEQHKAEDDRVFFAEVDLEKELIAAHIMSADDAIESIDLIADKALTVVFEQGATWVYPL